MRVSRIPLPILAAIRTLAPRSPLGTRKRQSGSIVGIDAKAGWNEDFTPNNFVRPLQGVFCADVSGEISTLGLNSTAIPITSVVGADNSYNAASGLAVFLLVCLISRAVLTQAANNGRSQNCQQALLANLLLQVERLLTKLRRQRQRRLK
jgi:hypothetical protein